MKIIAHALLSLETLWKNPVQWWGQRHWSLRLAFIVAILPILSSVSGNMYQQFSGKSADRQLLEETYTEVITLKSQLASLQEKNNQVQSASAEEIASLKARLSSTVLGEKDTLTQAVDDPVSEFPLYEATSSALQKNAFPVSINASSSKSLPVYASPNTTKQLGEVLTNQVYFATSEQNGWHKLELGKDTSGWIENKYITVLP